MRQTVSPERTFTVQKGTPQDGCRLQAVMNGLKKRRTCDNMFIRRYIYKRYMVDERRWDPCQRKNSRRKTCSVWHS